MSKTEQGPSSSREYIKVLKGTFLAALTGLTVQGCSRVDGNTSVPLPTGPAIETKQPVQNTSESGGFVPNIIVTEAEPEAPVITIGGSAASKETIGPSEEVPITIILDGGEPMPTSTPQSENPALTVSFDGTTTSPIETQASVSAVPALQAEFSSLEPERLKDVAKKIEQGTADDEIVENGRIVQIYSTKLKNAMSLVLVKETVDKQWDGTQSSVVFYDKTNGYVAYNTVAFGKRYLGNDAYELRFGKGKSSAIVRNAYVTPDVSGVSVLLSSREVEDSVNFLTRNKSISIYQQRQETDPVTDQRTVNIGGYVEKQNEFMREWEWLLDQSSGKHIYSLDVQPDGTFKEASKSSVEVNPTKNLD
ncbi:MAG: hypothetical protein AAB400_00130 [Patescibacteria group bacterium]